MSNKKKKLNLPIFWLEHMAFITKNKLVKFFNCLLNNN